MARSPASLVKLWDYEGQASSSSGIKSNEVKMVTPVSSSTGSVLKAELLKYYQKHGMESMAKEVGIIHTNGDVSANKQPQAQVPQRKAIIAVPVVTKSGGVVNMSPFKTDQAILPKNVHLSNSPVILSTPQRVVANVISTPRTPQTPSDRMPWSGKRAHGSTDADYSDSKKCKKGEKGGKGLRHFSMKVCEKVRRKGTTSYNEVADELVAEFTDPHRSFSPTEQAYDQKNIRRRVYDALNVLMAMNIISKEKKEIKWLGLPTNSAQEYQNLEREKQKRIERIRLKTQQLQELIQQQVAFKNLVERNRIMEKQTFPSPCSQIHLPFIIVNTDKKTVIDCSISPDKTEYLFHFNDTFQIHDDIEILKRMGMVLNLDKGCCSPEELEKAKQLVPKALQPYIIQMAQGITDFPPGMSGDDECGIHIDTDLYSDPSSDFQEPSSSSALGSEYVGIDVALEGKVGLSRQSSVGSLTDMPSRPEVSTPSEDFSDSESESSCADDV